MGSDCIEQSSRRVTGSRLVSCSTTFAFSISHAIVFSRRMPARMRSSAPSFSSRARTAARRAARPLRELLDFGVEVLVGRLDRLAPRDLVDDERALDRLVGGRRAAARGSPASRCWPSSGRRPAPSAGARTPRAGDRLPGRRARRAPPSRGRASCWSSSCRIWCFDFVLGARCCRSSRTRSRSASSVSSSLTSFANSSSSGSSSLRRMPLTVTS